MKKRFAALCALALIFAFSGCGEGGKNPADTQTDNQICFKRHLQTVYETGETLGEFSLAVVENGVIKIVSGNDPAVTVEGFDSSVTGERALTIRYKDYEKTVPYVVLLPQALRPPEPGDIVVRSLEELQAAFKKYDNIDVEADLVIEEESGTFVIPAGKRVVVKEGYTLTNNGTLFINGRLQGDVKGNLGIKEPSYDPDSGTFTVKTKEELAWCSWAMHHEWDVKRWNGRYNNGSGANLALDGFSHYVISIENDLDLNGFEWTPIGEWQYDTYEENTEDGWLPGLALTFKGEIRGNGHTVKGITVGGDESKLTRDAGFIGVADYEASIYDLTFENISVRGTNNVGAVIGYYHSHSWADGFLENVRVENAEIVGESSVGGLIGRITNVIRGCKIDINACNVEGRVAFGGGDDALYRYIGGIVGYAENYVEIADCTASVKLVAAAAGGSDFGGILGAWQQGIYAEGSGGIMDLVISGNDFSGVTLTGFAGELKEVGNR